MRGQHSTEPGRPDRVLNVPRIPSLEMQYDPHARAWPRSCPQSIARMATESASSPVFKSGYQSCLLLPMNHRASSSGNTPSFLSPQSCQGVSFVPGAPKLVMSAGTVEPIELISPVATVPSTSRGSPEPSFGRDHFCWSLDAANVLRMVPRDQLPVKRPTPERFRRPLTCTVAGGGLAHEYERIAALVPSLHRCCHGRNPDAGHIRRQSWRRQSCCMALAMVCRPGFDHRPGYAPCPIIPQICDLGLSEFPIPPHQQAAASPRRNLCGG